MNNSNSNLEENSSGKNNASLKKGEHIRISSFEKLRESTINLFSEASKLIQIYSHNLDPRILNNRETEKQLTAFIKKSRYCKIQILIYDENNLRGLDHRLVSLAQKFTSYVEIKIVPKDYHENPFAFYLVDRKTILYRTHADSYNAEFIRMPDFHLKDKAKLFETIWQISSPASFLRALHL